MDIMKAANSNRLGLLWKKNAIKLNFVAANSLQPHPFAIRKAV